MIRKELLLVLCTLSTLLHSQNLVINGGFENYSSCPNNQGQLNLALPWTSARGTCDLYNTCNNGLYDVPTNQVGTQNARTGNGYAGFFATQGFIETREYLHAQLSSPLVAGTEYCVKFYVVLADSLNSLGDNDYDVAVNDIGMYIGNTPYAPNPNLFTHLAVTPQIINNSSVQTLSDRINWMEISGSYTALGGEQYITIGSFAQQTTQDTTWLDIWNSNNFAYYLVDDVSLMDCSINPMSVTILGDNQICEGDSSILTAAVSGGSGPYSFIWSNGETSSSISVSPVQTETYTVTVTDSLGNSANIQFPLTVTPLPLFSLGNDIYSCPDSLFTLAANNSIVVNWSTGATGNSIQVSPSNDTYYWASLSVNGCVAYDSISIFFNDCEGDSLLIPNVFTPNSDGFNDMFNVSSISGKGIYSGKIFNRWGIEIAHFDQLISWDGNNKSGQSCSDGVYYYLIDFVRHNNEHVTYKGTIQLIR